MALFKILKGDSSNLPEKITEGYCYFCEDSALLYIDTKDGRKILNAQNANTLGGETVEEILADINKLKPIVDILTPVTYSYQLSGTTYTDEYAATLYFEEGEITQPEDVVGTDFPSFLKILTGQLKAFFPEGFKRAVENVANLHASGYISDELVVWTGPDRETGLKLKYRTDQNNRLDITWYMPTVKLICYYYPDTDTYEEYIDYKESIQATANSWNETPAISSLKLANAPSDDADATTKKYVDEQSVKDWEESDDSAPGYIRNRPFWGEVLPEAVIAEAKDVMVYGGMTPVVFEPTEPFEQGATYLAVIDDDGNGNEVSAELVYTETEEPAERKGWHAMFSLYQNGSESGFFAVWGSYEGVEHPDYQGKSFFAGGYAHSYNTYIDVKIIRQEYLKGQTLPEKYLPRFGGASAEESGTKGCVPAPEAGDQAKYLRGDGTWAEMSGGGGDGYSPAATVEQTDTGAIITITDKDGTTTAVISNGKDGDPGDDYVLTDEDKEEIAEMAAELVPSGGGDGGDITLGISGAEVGQIVKITAVDDEGKPTAWEAAEAHPKTTLFDITLEESASQIKLLIDDEKKALLESAEKVSIYMTMPLNPDQTSRGSLTLGIYSDRGWWPAAVLNNASNTVPGGSGYTGAVKLSIVRGPTEGTDICVGTRSNGNYSSTGFTWTGDFRGEDNAAVKHYLTAETSTEFYTGTTLRMEVSQ